MNFSNALEKQYAEILNIWAKSKDLRIPWWPKYVYHYTDIRNCMGILKSGELLSRNEAVSQHLMLNENANTEVIQHTHPEIKDAVRLYFRPLTPTQYRNEGYKTPDERVHNANVPVPVFLTFRSYKILAEPDCMFSEKGVNTRTGFHLCTKPEELACFDYRRIYSAGAFAPGDNETKEFRHAEVIIPNRHAIDDLENIWCRTPAEYQTLAYLMKKADIFSKYSHCLGLKESSELFYKNGAFIHDVSIFPNRIIVHLHTQNTNLELKFILSINGIQSVRSISRNSLSRTGDAEIRFDITDSTLIKIKNADTCTFEIDFDDIMMYRNHVSLSEYAPY